jgi:ABC-type multidrug transport system fused ATPase/permease subunit
MKITANFINRLNDMLEKMNKPNSDGYSFNYGLINLLFNTVDQAVLDHKYNKNFFQNNVVYIVGRTGSGKSTVLNYLAGVKLKVGRDDTI